MTSNETPINVITSRPPESDYVLKMDILNGSALSSKMIGSGFYQANRNGHSKKVVLRQESSV